MKSTSYKQIKREVSFQQEVCVYCLLKSSEQNAWLLLTGGKEQGPVVYEEDNCILLDSVVSCSPEGQHHLQARWNQGQTYCVPYPGGGLISWFTSYTFDGLGQAQTVLWVHLSVLGQGVCFIFL